MELETVTPILGGAPATRQVDTVDIIRVPTIRGHLRFWWRALYGVGFATSSELFAAESALWGKAADAKGGRSAVEIRAELQRRTLLDETDPPINFPSGYALWPARKTKEEPTAPRYRSGVRFRLSVQAPSQDIDSVKNTVRAWILFGGYGSRTRRGAGSLQVAGSGQERRAWLPSVEDAEDLEPEELREELAGALERLFGRDVLRGPRAARPFPTLSDATLLVGGHFGRERAEQAWGTSIAWLRTFRQGVGTGRDAGTGGKPGRSRWPEADKLRLLTNQYGHDPRYRDPTAAWPRAVFGLPIVGRFQGAREPPEFQLTWLDKTRKPDEQIQDRMASPLTLKVLPMVEGFRPCALWLARRDPPGEVVAVGPKKVLIANSSAPFGRMGGPTDAAVAARLRAPHAGKPNVQAAFIDWTKRQNDVVQVLP